MDNVTLQAHMLADEKFQDEMREWKNEVPTKDEIRDIVVEAIDAYFRNKGKLTFSFIVGSSVLIGALVVIFGGFKTVLAWLGFSYMSK